MTENNNNNIYNNNNDVNLNDLEAVEEKLSVYVGSEKNDRVGVYNLMEKVKREELYKAKDLKSFNAWVNAISSELGVGSSTLWRKYKAGGVIAEYLKRMGKSVGCYVAEDFGVSPDTVASIETLAGRDAKKLDMLLRKAIDGKISRQDIRLALKEKRRVAGDTIPKSRHDKIKDTDRTEISSVSASDLVLALSEWKWLSDMAREPIRLNNPIKTYLYYLETELGVVTGTSNHKRRFDCLVFENLTIDNNDNTGVSVHGIEIKVNKYDLLNDTKMQEYTNFCDYFYIAIPNDVEMISIARDVKLPNWGIMVYSENDRKVKILDKPKKLDPIFKDKVFENLILRLLGKSAKDFS